MLAPDCHVLFSEINRIRVVKTWTQNETMIIRALFLFGGKILCTFANDAEAALRMLQANLTEPPSLTP